ncbi:VWA domain-containing protein [Candidatus Woesearchaeota archaeon]|nr:VWA domain-containing protein [Candidatus Woesearchaeota archaeon]
MPVPGDSPSEDKPISIERASPIEELSGSLGQSDEDDKLMKSVLEGDKDKVDDGKLITESISQGLGSFTPDLMFEQLVQDYKNAERIMGQSIIRELTGYEPGYVERNINIPEFQRELKDRIGQRIKSLQENKYLDKYGRITRKGYKLCELIMYVEEIEKIVPKGFGERKEHKQTHYGDKKDYELFKNHRYRDVSVRQSIRRGIKRNHKSVEKDDLIAVTRESKGSISVIFAMDSSGSMKGQKISMSKRAGIALAFKAITDKNKSGLIVFDSEVKSVIPPTKDFPLILEELAKIRAGQETDISKAIDKAIEVFPGTRETKHLVIITDAMPTKGQKPKKATLQAVGRAREEGITVSMLGISLDEEGEKLGRQIVDIGNGRFYGVKDLDRIDALVLEEYELSKSMN